jgi:hypothetical protein
MEMNMIVIFYCGVPSTIQPFLAFFYLVKKDNYMHSFKCMPFLVGHWRQHIFSYIGGVYQGNIDVLGTHAFSNE